MNLFSKKTYGKKQINQALGVFLILFALLCLLSPGTKRLWGLGAGIVYLFGVEGLYLVVPFLMFSGFVLAITGSWDKPDVSGRVGYGFTLAALGIGMFWSHFGLKGTESSSNFSIFRNAYNAYANNRVGYYTANDLGGGVIGYFFAGVFVKPGMWLLTLIGVFLILAGLVIIFLPLIKKFFVFLHGKIVLKKAKRQAAKESLQNQEMEESSSSDSSYDSFASARPMLTRGAPSDPAPSRTQLTYAPAPSAPQAQPQPTVSAPQPAIPSRFDLYGSSSFKNPLPQDLTTPEAAAPRPAISPSQMYSSGLQEALFIPDASFMGQAPLSQAASSLQNIPNPTFSSPAPASPKPAAAPVIPTPAPQMAEPTFFNEVTLEERPAPSPVQAAPVMPKPVAPAPTAVQSAPVYQAPARPAPAMQTPVQPVAPSPRVSEIDEIPEEEQEAAIDVTSNEVEPETFAPAPAPVMASVTPAPSAVVSPKPVAPSPAPEPSNPVHQPDAVARPSYAFPSIELLNVPVASGNAEEVKADCERTKETVDRCFSDFKVGAHVDSYTVGPSVTRYNVMCDPNVSVTTISRYIDDISQRLNGLPARFQEVVRGQNTSGLEIPNKVTTPVPLREVISHLPTGPNDNLVIPFGKTISGEYLKGDLSKFPHMLVAGTSGSGKSIFMHGIIMSLIMRNRPEDLKLVLIDPKRVEMNNYFDIPHLLCPIIKEPSQAKVCLDKLIIEMERRYSLFEWSHVRDIRQFNKDYAPSHKLAPLPFIVVVVDEFADLVDTCKEVSDSVVRIAQKARAAGIHLIISTQRPSVDIITGVIKANLNCRVALRVSQANDSVCILGQGGAEDLAGYGDMLVDCETVFRGGFIRAQGAMVETNELDAVCDYIKSQQTVNYDPNFLDLVDHEAEEKKNQAFEDDNAPSRQEIKANDDEDYYQQLKAQVMTRQYTSISRIQRENGLGFPRAGRLFNRLVSEGVVAPEPDTPGSSKGCRVLKHVDPNNAEPPAGSTDSLKFANDGHLGDDNGNRN